MATRLKQLSIVLVILGIVGAIFWQQIWGAMLYYKIKAELEPKLFYSSYSLEPVSFDSTERLITTEPPHQIGTVAIPITFTPTAARSTENWVANDTKSIGLFTSASDDLVTRINNTTGGRTVDRDAACQLLTRTYGKNSCDNSFAMYRAYLALTKSDISLFTPAKQQQAFYQLMLVKNASEPGNIAFEFETGNLKGFLIPIDDDSFKAVLFLNDTDSHETVFNGFTKKETLDLIANTTVKQ